MKGWRVSDGECCIYARADTRNKARDCWPGNAWDFRDVMALRVRRAPRLDGPTPIFHIDPVEIVCECDGDANDGSGCGLCFEGMRIDWDATIAKLAELDRSAG